jgi:hypothetical protein
MAFWVICLMRLDNPYIGRLGGLGFGFLGIRPYKLHSWYLKSDFLARYRPVLY